MKYTDILDSVQKQLTEKATILPQPTTEIQLGENGDINKKSPQEGLVDKQKNNEVVESQRQKIEELRPNNPSDQLPIAGESKSSLLQTTENQTKAEDDMDFTEVEDMEEESPEMEMMEYKKDFYEMSLGSLRAIATHANEILGALDMPHVKENLTESWLQGKIAITEDYMRTIHDFIMYVSEAADNISAADRPGLWENIRKKKEREGKNYKPAKRGDKDRPNPESWKKAQK